MGAMQFDTFVVGQLRGLLRRSVEETIAEGLKTQASTQEYVLRHSFSCLLIDQESVAVETIGPRHHLVVKKVNHRLNFIHLSMHSIS